MFEVELMTAPKGKWNFKPGKDIVFKAAALKAMKFLFHRIHKQNKDANGRRLPDLNSARSWFFFSAKDPRWAIMREKGRKVKKKRGGPSAKKIAAEARTKFFKGGYANAKKAVGASPKRDGWFSGSMWRSLTPQVKKVRGQLMLRLYFAGSTKTHESAGAKMVDGKKRIVWKTKGVRNRTKAWWMQFNNRKEGNQKPKFVLMAFTNAETSKIVQEIIPGYMFNGAPLIQGRHKKFPRFN